MQKKKLIKKIKQIKKVLKKKLIKKSKLMKKRLGIINHLLHLKIFGS